jgi:hypothetical protein
LKSNNSLPSFSGVLISGGAGGESHVSVFSGGTRFNVPHFGHFPVLHARLGGAFTLAPQDSQLNPIMPPPAFLPLPELRPPFYPPPLPAATGESDYFSA